MLTKTFAMTITHEMEIIARQAIRDVFSRDFLNMVCESSESIGNANATRSLELGTARRRRRCGRLK
jgi:hypothetical protein